MTSRQIILDIERLVVQLQVELRTINPNYPADLRHLMLFVHNMLSIVIRATCPPIHQLPPSQEGMYHVQRDSCLRQVLYD
jgi:hypothetical protein